jgi:hypothetical protein
MEKLARAGEGGGVQVHPLSLYSRYHHAQSCSVPYAPAEWADTLTLIHLYQYTYSVHACNYRVLQSSGPGSLDLELDTDILEQKKTFSRYLMISREIIPSLLTDPTKFESNLWIQQKTGFLI